LCHLGVKPELTQYYLFRCLVVAAKSLTTSVSPTAGSVTTSTAMSSMPDSSLNNNSSRRQKSVFVSPQGSPTRFGGSYITNSLQRTSAAGLSPVDGTATVPVDSTEAARKSKTLPLHADKFPSESNVVPRNSGVVDGPGDMATYGVAPKALSRDELAGTDLDIGSMVEFDIGSERHYGVIRWIGYLSDKRHVIVGIELVSNRSANCLLFVESKANNLS